MKKKESLPGLLLILLLSFFAHDELALNKAYVDLNALKIQADQCLKEGEDVRHILQEGYSYEKKSEEEGNICYELKKAVFLAYSGEKEITLVSSCRV
jgi:hypothetical protein